MECPVCSTAQPSLAVLNAHLDAHFNSNSAGTNEVPETSPAHGGNVAGWIKKAAGEIKEGLKRMDSGLGELAASGASRTGSRAASFNLKPEQLPIPAIPSLVPSKSPAPSLPTPGIPPTPPPTLSFLRRDFKPPDPVSHTGLFIALRASHPKRMSMDRLALDVNRIEGRYKKLHGIHATSRPSRIREKEREIVRWQEDRTSIRCAECGELFGLSRRKHHCRLNGECICGSESCSIFVPLYEDYTRGGDSAGEIRACGRCVRLLERLRGPIEEREAIVDLHSKMVDIKRTALSKLEEFNTVLGKLAGGFREADAEYVRAQGLRKELTNLLTQFDGLSKQIAALPGKGQRKKVAENIRRAAVLFLQERLFTLQLLPAPSSSSSAKDPALEPPTQTKASLARISQLNETYGALAAQKEALEGQLKSTEGPGRREERTVLLEARTEIEKELQRVSEELSRLIV